LEEKVPASVYKTQNTVVGIRRAHHATPLYSQKSELTSPTRGGRSVSIVHSQTKATEVLLDDHAMLQTTFRRIFTAKVQSRFQGSSCGFCGEKSGTGVDFYSTFSLVL
jgi:hypothetical protein